MIGSFITTGGAIFGTFGTVGFIVAAFGYLKARSVETLHSTNEILQGEVEALTQSRDRMREEMDAAKELATKTTKELARVAARTDLSHHQKHLDEQHVELVAGLTRIADESEQRNGHIAAALLRITELVAKQAGGS